MAGSGASFKIDFGGLDKLLDHAVDHFKSSTKSFMEECGEIIVTGIDDAFETETAPDGKRWKKSKRAAREGGKTLTRTSGSGLRGSIGYDATSDTVAVGTNKDYAVYHQQPERDGKIMPKREFIGISDETADELKGALDDFMREGFKP